MRLTLSKTGLAPHCVWFARPDVPEQSREPSIYARKGVALHALIEHNGDAPEGVWVGLSEKDQEEVRGWYFAWLTSPLAMEEWEHEVAVAIDPRAGSARRLGTKERDYSGCAPHEIPGTADLVRVEADRVVVCDLKTGAQLHTEPAATNTQLHNYALALCRAHGVTAATVIVAKVGDEVEETWAELTAEDLDAIEQELAATIDVIPSAEPMPGLHCRERFCPALAICPATAEAVQAIAPGEPLTLNLAAMEHADLERLLARVDLVSKMTEAVSKALKAEADARGGIQLSDGRVWARRVRAVETIEVGDDKLPTVREILAQFGAESALKTKHVATKDALKEAIRDTGAKVAPTMRAVLPMLRAAGVVSEHTQSPYEARK